MAGKNERIKRGITGFGTWIGNFQLINSHSRYRTKKSRQGKRKTGRNSFESYKKGNPPFPLKIFANECKFWNEHSPGQTRSYETLRNPRWSGILSGTKWRRNAFIKRGACQARPGGSNSKRKVERDIVVVSRNSFPNYFN